MEQTSKWMSLHSVERVLNTLPQLQVAVISVYSGWISVFMDSGAVREILRGYFKDVSSVLQYAFKCEFSIKSLLQSSTQTFGVRELLQHQ